MKILVVNPPAFNKKDYIREGRCMQTKSSWAALWMPLSLCYISAFLRDAGHEVKLVDCIAEKMNNRQFIDLSSRYHPDVVILNTAIPSLTGDMNSAEEIKKALPAVKIVIVGMYPTLYGKESLLKFSQIDYAIVDEPEWAVRNLMNALGLNQSPDLVKGLIFRKDGSIIVNERQRLSENKLDDLPFPARDLLKNDAYKLPTNGKRFTLLSVGRGCSGNCIYCVANVYYGRKFRKRSVDSVVNEIEECVEKYEIYNFLFWGESFTTDSKYGEAICDEIIRRNIKISWSTTSRVDTLNQSLLDKMKSAGCILLGLGIESYDQKVLDNARKGINIQQIEKAVAMVRKSGINSMGHFMFGLPGDTRDSAARSINFAIKNFDFAQFYCAIPYPETELGRIARVNNWISSNDYTQFELTKSVMGNESLTPGEVKRIRDSAYRKFYLRPKMFFRTLREVDSLRSFFSVLNFFEWIKPGEE